jgi:hypothetical protein
MRSVSGTAGVALAVMMACGETPQQAPFGSAGRASAEAGESGGAG